jgi:hypothetical protein
MIKRFGYTRKKDRWVQQMRDQWLRATWRVMVTQMVDPRRLVFVDEMGTNTSLSPVYAYSPKGRRAYAEVPRNRGKNTTLLSCMSIEGMGPSLAVEGATDAAVFEAYVDRILLPVLDPGQVPIRNKGVAFYSWNLSKLKTYLDHALGGG